MPRKELIDAPGALHHIICRGIEQRNIFRDDTDRNRVVDRLSAEADRLLRIMHCLLKNRNAQNQPRPYISIGFSSRLLRP